MTTAKPVRHAIILAAGLCARLRGVVDDRPKGLIDIGGETLVGRSVRLLRDANIEHITIVTGYCADYYERFAVGQTDIHLLVNDEFATTGSMASLVVALARVHSDVLVLESDIVYEARALSTLLHSAAADATLISGPTDAGDEVWVYAPDARLDAMSKIAHELPAVTGEFVGITRLSAATAAAMRQAFERFVDAHGHRRMNYETDALVGVGRLFPIATLLMADLCWGEVDDERQLARVIEKVWPAVGNQRRQATT
jgi:choline kinase